MVRTSTARAKASSASSIGSSRATSTSAPAVATCTSYARRTSSTTGRGRRHAWSLMSWATPFTTPWGTYEQHRTNHKLSQHMRSKPGEMFAEGYMMHHRQNEHLRGAAPELHAYFC